MADCSDHKSQSSTFLPKISIQNCDYQVENVPGDGNCFFHCLSMAFYGNFSRSDVLRYTICQTILNNWKQWENKVEIFHGPQITHQKYRTSMLELNDWAASCEIEAASQLFDCTINVWLKCTNDSFQLTTFTHEEHNSQHISLLLENNHFKLLHEVTQTQTGDVLSTAKHVLQSSINHDHCYSSRVDNNSHVTNTDTHFVSDTLLNHLDNSILSFQNPTESTSSNPAFLSPAENHVIRNISENNHKKMHLHLLDHSYCDYHYADDHYQNEINLYCTFEPNSEQFHLSDHTYSACQLTDSNSQLRNSAIHSNNKLSKTSHPNPESSTAQRQRKRFSLGEYLFYSPNSTQIKRLKSNKQNFNSLPVAKSSKLNADNLRCKAMTKTKDDTKIHRVEKEVHAICRKLGILYEHPSDNETKQERAKRMKRMNKRIKSQEHKLKKTHSEIPHAPPPTGDEILDNALDHMRAFELKQMSYTLDQCSICHECRINMKMHNSTTCFRCYLDKDNVKMFSAENNMDPKPLPCQLQDLSIIEQQLICRISPCINIHMLKHGGISSNGHCVTFPQEINETAKIFPRLPEEVKIIKIRKRGRNETSKDFRVRRLHVQNALFWLKTNNPAYSDIIISQDRLGKLPLDGECHDVPSISFNEDNPLQ